MKQPDNEDFITWLDFLKKNHDIKYSEAGKSSGIDKARISNIRYSRTKASKEDFKKLAIAFPILRERALALGIDPTPETDKDLAHLSNAQKDELGETLMAAINERLTDMEKLIDDLKGQLAAKDEQIARLLNIIEAQQVAK